MGRRQAGAENVHADQALRVGIGTWIGLAVGTLGRVAIGVAMIVVFLAALIL